MRALVVDDEAPARTRLLRMLQNCDDVEIIGEASNGLEALEMIESLRPEVVFLDIEMPELDGLGVAEALNAEGPAIVFVTAFNEHALKAFDLSAIDYLLKPVTQPRLDAALIKIRQRHRLPDRNYRDLIEATRKQAVRKFALKCGSKFRVLDPNEISAIIARDHYAAIVVNEREYLADDSIDALTRRLNPETFLRVHRSAAINLHYLKDLEREGDRKYVAILSDVQKTRVPVARERMNELKTKLGLL